MWAAPKSQPRPLPLPCPLQWSPRNERGTEKRNKHLAVLPQHSLLTCRVVSFRDFYESNRLFLAVYVRNQHKGHCPLLTAFPAVNPWLQVSSKVSQWTFPKSCTLRPSQRPPQSVPDSHSFPPSPHDPAITAPGVTGHRMHRMPYSPWNSDWLTGRISPQFFFYYLSKNCALDREAMATLHLLCSSPWFFKIKWLKDFLWVSRASKALKEVKPGFCTNFYYVSGLIHQRRETSVCFSARYLVRHITHLQIQIT